ncbi:SDR family NAD(P)-dependent oxidoreductase [Deinococcus alpinitundrae]|uniref:SDR family NAD(P)-dependent oxidoreductase n=1 Tax=Deinococcus alpinitundrae TaxID=468913 RepID=UPI00137A7F3C|nr:SDR family NAD(P)-dependent oxidoreductase [Deinococcus alpinitundrae]
MTTIPTLSNSPHLRGKTALVTGGTFGIGRATAAGLARLGAGVVITGRSQARAEEAVEFIQRQSGSSDVSYLLADFLRPTEVRALAGAFIRTRSRLDILVNNAGGTFETRQLMPEGLERTWALNHLAYVQLTLSLLPLLRESAPARVVNVASGLYAGAINFEDLSAEKNFNRFRAYVHSKLANHLFTYELARRLAGTGVTVNAVNPGIVDTGLGSDAKGMQKLLSSLLSPLKKSPEVGALPSLYMATSAEVEGVSGRFFDKTKFVEPRPVTRDHALQDRLWQVSLEQLGRSPDALATAVAEH